MSETTHPRGRNPDALMARYRATRDPGVLGELFDATAPRLFRLASTLVPTAAAAEDVLQDSFLAVLSGVDRFESGRPVLPWLTGILRRQAGKTRRRLARTPDVRRLADRTPEEDPARAVVRREEDERVRRALLDLDEPYRAAALLRWRHGLEPAEIAEVLDRPPGTIWSLLSRARTRLKGRLAALASLLPWVPAPRGLTAVRRTIVGQAVRTAARVAGPAVAVAGGGLIVKKIIAAVVVLVLLLSGWLLVRGRLPQPDPERRTSAESAIAAEPAPGRPGTDEEADEETDEPPSPEVALPGRIPGVVIDEAGAAVPGARILSHADDLDRTVGEEDAGRDVGAATADPRGRFEVPVTGRSPFYDLVVTAAGYAPTRSGPHRNGEAVRVVLGRGYSLAGRVFDHTGNPVAGARVAVLGLVGLARVEATGVSGPDGAYRVPGVPRGILAGGFWYIRVDHSAHPPLFVARYGGERRATSGEIEQDLALPRPATIRGRVVDAVSGEGLPGALVTLTDPTGIWNVQRPGGGDVVMPFSPCRLIETRTGEDGLFVLRRAPAGGYHDRPGPQNLWLGAEAEGRTPAVRRLLGLRQDEEVTLSLHASTVVEGRVVDAEGRPVQGVRVAVVRVAGDASGAVLTDAGGLYRIPDAPVDASSLDIRIRAGSGGWGGSLAEVVVSTRAGEVVRAPDLRVASTTSTNLRFRVSDRGGQALWGAEVGVLGLGFFVRTGPDGIVSLPWRPGPRQPGAPRAHVKAPGFAPAILPLVLDVEGHVHEVVLDPPHRLSGRVLCADGRPAAGARVEVVGVDVSAADAVSSRAGFHYVRPELPLLALLGAARAGDDGCFDVKDLPGTPAHVLATLPSGTGRGPGLRAIADSVAPDRTDVEIVLPAEDLPTTGVVEGVLLDASSGTAILESFRVALIGDGVDGSLTPETRFPGQFRFSAVPVGSWRLVVVAEGYLSTERPGIHLTQDGVSLRIGLERGARVAGRLRTGSGAVPDGGSVSFLPLSPRGLARPVTSPLGADGAFSAAGLHPGRYRILATVGPGAGSAHVPQGDPTVEIAAGPGPRRLDLVVEPAGRVVVQVRGVREADRAQLRLEVSRPGGAWSYRESTGGREVAVLVLAPGTHRLRLTAGTVVLAEATVEVDAGEGTSVTMTAD